jgi:hypothetical protein
MDIDRRHFLAGAGSLCAGGLIGLTARGALGQPARTPQTPQTRLAAPAKVVVTDAVDGAELQKLLYREAGNDCCVRMDKPREVTCLVREDPIGSEKSIHALLVPEGVQLDLNGATLRLDLRSNSYGVRLASRAAVRNGTIRVVRSEGKGSQACWHSGVSIGAAYGDGGTPEKPGHFSKVTHWAIENLTIDQQVAASAIQLMSEACHGTIKNIRILDSEKALLGIGLDWGSVGSITSEDKEIPRMRRLWEQGRIYSTHPHDVTIEDIRVGTLLRNVDGNDAGVRCSACHRITIRNVTVDTAATAVAIFGGDLGYEFAPEDQRNLAHTGYVIENVRIASALKYGIVLNGNADNVWRARRNHGYDAVRDPVHPGLDNPAIRNVVLRSGNMPGAQGIYAVALSDATLDKVEITGFEIGVHVEDWVRGMRFRNCTIAGNKQNTRIEGTTEPAVGVVFDPPV